MWKQAQKGQVYYILQQNQNTTLCLKFTQNVAFEFLSFGIFQHFLSY